MCVSTSYSKFLEIKICVRSVGRVRGALGVHRDADSSSRIFRSKVEYALQRLGHALSKATAQANIKQWVQTAVEVGQAGS